jgi:hypothetical protein
VDVVGFAVGFGHWQTGASDVTIDDHVVKTEKRRQRTPLLQRFISLHC